MTKFKNMLQTGAVSRRTVLRGMAVAGAAIALPGIAARPAAAATPGSNPGKYKIDLGGYGGPELTDQPITLKFMRQDFTPQVNATFDKAYAAFKEAYPNISIEEERVPYGDLPQKVQVYVASGTAPDIMMGRNDFASAYAAGEFVLPLDELLTPEFIADVLPPLRESATIDGKLLCLPWETNPTFLHFNREIFKKAGVETPPEVADVNQGWTVEQYLDAMDRITTALRAAGDKETFGLQASVHGGGGPGSNYTQNESIWVRMMGDPKADKESSAYKTFLGVSEDGLTASGYLDTPEAIKGMTNYQTMFSKGYTPKGIQPDMYRAGIAATAFDSMNTANIFRQNGSPFEWGCSPAPRGTIAYSTTVADSPFIYAGTPNPNEAAALLAFINNDTNRKAFHGAWGSMPVRLSLIDAEPAYKTDSVNMLALSSALAAYGPPKTVGWFDYFSAVNPAVKDIALGADPATRLKEAAVQIDGLLAKYK